MAADKYVRSGRRKFLPPSALPVFVAVAIFMTGSSIVEMYNASTLRYEPIVDSLVEPAFWFLSFVAACSVVTNSETAESLIKGFILPVFLAVPLAVAQVLDIEPVIRFTTLVVSGRGVADSVAEGELLRAGGLVGGWTSFGAYLTGVFAAAIALMILNRQRSEPLTILPLAVAVLCIVGLLTTLTFSTAIAFVVLLVGSARRLGFHPGVFAAAVGAVVLAVFAFGSRIRSRFAEQFDSSVGYVDWLPEWVPNTLGYRIFVWGSQTIPSILERPVTGWGNKVYLVTLQEFGAADVDRIRPAGLEWSSAESQWLWTLMNSGVLGLALLVILLCGILSPIRLGWRSSEARWIALPVALLLASNIAIAFTAIGLTNKGLPGTLWPLLGVVAALAGGRQELAKPSRISAVAQFNSAEGARRERISVRASGPVSHDAASCRSMDCISEWESGDRKR
ncbi:O-antigen ligase family protein [Gordonia sp. NPDC127522]|uniref:O-antigen ligase family protein n=1 Tax=Gordonia sp. NPDC127522 TaxID=3345390 RepID=UPI0036366FF0